MSRCCLGPTSHIWGCSKPSKGSKSQLANDEATKTSLLKISPTSTFPTWWELAPPSCLHSHITLGPSPLLRRPNKFGQPTRGSVGIRSYIFLRKLANNYTNMTISKSNKTYEPTCFLCLSNRHAGMIFLVPRIPPESWYTIIICWATPTM